MHEQVYALASHVEVEELALISILGLDRGDRPAAVNSKYQSTTYTTGEVPTLLVKLTCWEVSEPVPWHQPFWFVEELP